MRRAFIRPWLARQLGGLTLREVVLRTYDRIIDQAVMTRAAAISFYGIAAFVPFMGLVIVLLAYGLPWVERAFSGGLKVEPLDPLEALLPLEALKLVRFELNRLSTEPHPGMLSFGVASILWLSSSVYVEIIDAMHAIRGCKDTRPFWRRRLIAIVMTLGTAAILISAMLTIVIWPQILHWLGLSGSALDPCHGYPRPRRDLDGLSHTGAVRILVGCNAKKSRRSDVTRLHHGHGGGDRSQRAVAVLCSKLGELRRNLRLTRGHHAAHELAVAQQLRTSLGCGSQQGD